MAQIAEGIGKGSDSVNLLSIGVNMPGLSDCSGPDLVAQSWSYAQVGAYQKTYGTHVNSPQKAVFWSDEEIQIGEKLLLYWAQWLLPCCDKLNGIGCFKKEVELFDMSLSV